MGVQFPRQKELLEYYATGPYVVAGAAMLRYARSTMNRSRTPSWRRVEYIFPRFCRDFERGEAKALYHEPTPSR